MTIAKTLAVVCLAAFPAALPSLAGDERDRDGDTRCKRVNGHATWTLIPAPNDQFGRILGPSTGDLRASITAIITSLTTAPSGTITAKSLEVWVLGATDLLVMDGQATFTPIPGKPIGTVHDELTLTVAGGTGAYEGATGTINVEGIGRNIFGPESGPGKGYFEVNYKGQVCRAR